MVQAQHFSDDLSFTRRGLPRDCLLQGHPRPILHDDILGIRTPADGISHIKSVQVLQDGEGGIVLENLPGEPYGRRMATAYGFGP
jgi:hypothetical protein